MAGLTVITLRTASCWDNGECDGLHRIAERPGRLYGIAKPCADPAVIEALSARVGRGELLWEMEDLIPEVRA